MNPQLYFYWYDYIIFLLVLGLSALIGVYFGCFGTKQTTTNEYLMGNKKINYLPVGLSIAVSHFSAVTLITIPADSYRYGAYFLWTVLSMVLLTTIILYVYLPVFFNLQLTTSYDYLEMRFDTRTKLLVSILYLIRACISGSVLVYGPSLALSVATGFNVHIISFVTSSVCIFYTAIGGLKSVIWTDLFQLVIIILSYVVIIIVGTRAEGSFSTLWEKTVTGGRLDIFDFDIDPTKRDSFWIYIVGYTLHYVYYIGLDQSGVQKFLTLKTYKECIKSAICNAIVMSIVAVLMVFTGFTIYARYIQCDPLLSKKIIKHDQITSYFVLDITKNMPGFSALFFATLFCGSLSTFSCSLNAVSGVTHKIFLKKLLNRNISEKSTINILKIVVIIYGFVSTILIFLIQHLGEVFGLLISLIAISEGPTLGLFTLGVLFPQANATGAFYGGIVGFITVLSVVVPNKYYQYRQSIIFPTKPLSVDGCANNFTTTYNNYTHVHNRNVEDIPFLFRISHFYDCVIGAAASIVFGIIISYCSRKNNARVNKMLITPCIRRLLSEEEEETDGRVLDNLLK